MDKLLEVGLEFDLDFAEYNFRKPGRLGVYAEAVRSNSYGLGGLPKDGLQVSVLQVAGIVALNQLIDGKKNQGAYAELLAAFDPDEADAPREYDLVDQFAQVSVNDPSLRSQVLGQYLRANGLAVSDAQVEAVRQAVKPAQRNLNAREQGNLVAA